MDRPLAGLALLGFVLGGLATWLWPPPAPSPPAAVPVRALPARVALRQLPDDCAPRHEALVQERDRLAGAVDAARLTHRFLEAQRVQREGQPVPWPDDIAAVETPAGFADALEASLQASGVGERVDLDCDEYPCIASILLTEVLSEGGVSDAPLAPLFDAMNARGFADLDLLISQSTVREGEDGFRQVFTFAVGPVPSLAENVKIRTRFRSAKAFEIAKDRLEQAVAP